MGYIGWTEIVPVDLLSHDTFNFLMHVKSIPHINRRARHGKIEKKMFII